MCVSRKKACGVCAGVKVLYVFGICAGMRVVLMFVLCATVASALSLSDYPHLFVDDNVFEAKYVLGDEASPIDVVSGTILSTNLARFENLTTDVGTTMMDSEVANIEAINAIVIGNPCISYAAAVLEGNPDDCFEGLEGSTGYVKLFEHGTRVQLLISGLTPEDRQVVARKLAEGDFENVDDAEIAVKTGTGTVAPKPVAAEQKSRELDEREEPEIEETEPVSVPLPEEVPPEEPYEPLEVDRPEQKGFFKSLWDGIANFFRNLWG